VEIIDWTYVFQRSALLLLGWVPILKLMSPRYWSSAGRASQSAIQKSPGDITGAKPMSLKTIYKPTRSEMMVRALHRPDGLVEILPGTQGLRGQKKKRAFARSAPAQS
jgi:hypothetical protein